MIGGSSLLEVEFGLEKLREEQQKLSNRFVGEMTQHK